MRLLTDASLCVKRIAFESRSPTDRTLRVEKQRSGGMAIVSVTATSEIADSHSRFVAGPDNNACVAQQYTSRAPSSLSARDASDTVPAGAIMSSTSMQYTPSTSPQ